MKKFIIPIAILLIAGGTVLAEDIWQVGKPNGAVDPKVGSAEFPATGAWDASYDYNVGDDADPINAPSMPGYIGSDNVCAFANDGRACTDTTAELNINFTLGCLYNEVTLIYDRYGSEQDNIYLDGDTTPIATPSATEGGFQQFSIALGSLEAGPHTLTIEYAGGGSGNGHYIDYLQLTGTQGRCPANVNVHPFSDPNPLNLGSGGSTPVAILGSQLLDVTQIDLATITLGTAGVKVVGKADRQLCSFQDIGSFDPDVFDKLGDPDGFLDLVCHFVTAEIAPVSDGEVYTVTVSFELIDGTGFAGQDIVKITKW